LPVLRVLGPIKLTKVAALAPVCYKHSPIEMFGPLLETGLLLDGQLLDAGFCVVAWSIFTPPRTDYLRKAGYRFGPMPR